MKHRSPVAVFFLTLVTLGIYGIYWSVSTKNEMNRQGAGIPTAWLIIIPFVSIYWVWKYSAGVEKVTNGKLSGVLAFVLLILLGSIGMAVVQSEFNNVGATAPAGAAPAPGPMPAAGPGVQPDNSFGGPVSPAPAAPPVPPTPPSPMPVTPPAPQPPAGSPAPMPSPAAPPNDPNVQPPQPPQVQVG